MLAAELECEGHTIERSGDGFRTPAIPREIERAFSKRRQAIKAAAETHGYKSAKGMELAALRTRRAKPDVHRDALFETWRLRREPAASSCDASLLRDRPSIDRR